ncbi:Fic family protein [Denitrificimonas caeni]|uniref:Fic family protein n=1 Tax=Denitrificimonas caeni TaxID=521720 RepID=UPI0019642265|nr:Fic family protein [Denitrificimonas caeni]
MSRIKKPLQNKDIASISFERVLPLMRDYGVVDAKGRYLHWHELQRRIPTTVDREAVWAAIKLSRAAVLKSIGLVSESDEHFRLFIPDSCQQVIHRVEQLTAEIGLNRNTLTHTENSRYLVDSLMMEEAISSAQLEGAATTRKIAKEMLETEREPINDDERMVLNNYLLMRQAKYTKDEPLTVDLICQFHETATNGVNAAQVNPGFIRESDDVVVDDGQGDVAHVPPSFVLLPKRLEMLCEFANALHDGQEGRIFIHPMVKAIILHFMIGYEHPFRDGNGRTARCLFYWYMLKNGYWAFEYISISSLLKKAPVQYGESYLYTETDEFDLTYFVVYQMKIIGRAVHDFLGYIEEKRRDYFELMLWLEKTGVNKQLNYRQGQLLRKTLKNPGRVFTAKEVKNDFDVSEGTARSDLDGLVRLRVLAKVKEGKTYLYIARRDAEQGLKGR